MGASKLSLTHVQLTQLLVPVLPHADNPGADWGLPVLQHVHLQTRAGFLTATATDRYTCAIARVPAPEDVKVDALLHAGDAKALLAMFKPKRGQHDQELELAFSEGQLQVTGGGVLFSNAVVTYALGGWDFPKVRFIFEERLGVKGDGEPFALNPALLAKFAVASKALGQLPMRVHTTSQHRPTLVTVGDSFIGAIMPVKSTDDEDAPDWTTFLEVPVVKGQLAGGK